MSEETAEAALLAPDSQLDMQSNRSEQKDETAEVRDDNVPTTELVEEEIPLTELSLENTPPREGEIISSSKWLSLPYLQVVPFFFFSLIFKSPHLVVCLFRHVHCAWICCWLHRSNDRTFIDERKFNKVCVENLFVLSLLHLKPLSLVEMKQE